MHNTRGICTVGLMLVTCGLLAAATGSNSAIAGDWKMVRAVPNAETFGIDDVHFAKDGTYTATVTIEGKTTRERGTYHFNGYKIFFRPSGGGQHVYNAANKPSSLDIIQGERRVVLKKVDADEQE